jgi:hypothetical protein
MSVPTRRPRGNDTYYDNPNEPYYDTRDRVPRLQQPASPVCPQNLSNTPDANRQNGSMMMPPPSFQQRPDPASIRQKPHHKKKAPPASQTADADMLHQNYLNVPGSPFLGQQLTRTSSNKSSNHATETPSYFGNQGDHYQTAGRSIDGPEPTVNGNHPYHAQAMLPMDGSPQPMHGAPVFPAQYDEESPPYSALSNTTVDGPNAVIRRPSENGWNSGPENAPPPSKGYEQPFQMMNPSNDAPAHFHDDATANNQVHHGGHGQHGMNTSLQPPRPRHDDPDALFGAGWREAFQNQQQGERDFRQTQAQSAFLKAQPQRGAVQTYPQRNALPAQPNRRGNVLLESIPPETVMGMTGDLQPMARNPSRQRSEANTPGRSTPAPFGMQIGQHESHPTRMHDGRGFLSSHANAAAPSPMVHASLEIDEFGLASLRHRPRTTQYPPNKQNTQYEGRAQTPVLGAGLGGNVRYPQEHLGNDQYHQRQGLSLAPTLQPPAGNVQSPYRYITSSGEIVVVTQSPYHGQASVTSHIAPAPPNHPPVQQDRYIIAERQSPFAPRNTMAQRSQTNLPADRQGQLVSRNPTPQPPRIVLTPTQRATLQERNRRRLQIIDAFNRVPLQTLLLSATRPQQPYVRLHHIQQMSPMIVYEPTSLTDIGPPVTAASAEAWVHFLNEGGFGQDFEEIANLCHTIPIEGPPVMALAADGGLEIQAGVWDHTNDWWSQGNVTDEWLLSQSGDVTDEGLAPRSGGGRVLEEGVDLNGMQFEGEGIAGPSTGGSHAGGQYAGGSFADIPFAIDPFAGETYASEPSTGGLNPGGPHAGGPRIGGMAGGSGGKRKRVEDGADESQTEE